MYKACTRCMCKIVLWHYNMLIESKQKSGEKHPTELLGGGGHMCGREKNIWSTHVWKLCVVSEHA